MKLARVVTAALLLHAVGATSAGAWLPSDFEVWGRQALPVLSLEGRPERPASGDIVKDRDLPFVLDGPEVPTTRYAKDEGRLYDGTRLVGVVVTECSAGDGCREARLEPD